MSESRGSIMGAVGAIFTKAKQSAFSYVQQMIDDQITKKLGPYLATGVGVDGEERSDVVVNENGDILIENCELRPSAMDALLAENELPFHVVMAHCERIFIDIPWGDLTNGEFTFEISGLNIVLVPKERGDWSIDDVRRVKEALISKDLAKLIANLNALNAKPKKPGFFANLANRLKASLKPVIRVRDVHLRFERFSQDAPIPFTMGFLMRSLDVQHTTSEEMLQETLVTLGKTGVYCNTEDMNAQSVLPKNHVMYAKEPHFNVPKDKRARGPRGSSAGSEAALPSAGGQGAKDSAKERERQEIIEQIEMEEGFFERQDAIRTKMEAFQATAENEWAPDEWFLGPIEMPENSICMHVQLAFKVRALIACTQCVRSVRALGACAQCVRSVRALSACAQCVRSVRALSACAQCVHSVRALSCPRSAGAAALALHLRPPPPPANRPCLLLLLCGTRHRAEAKRARARTHPWRAHDADAKGWGAGGV
jgi:hypothetical protein